MRYSKRTTLVRGKDIYSSYFLNMLSICLFNNGSADRRTFLFRQVRSECVNNFTRIVRVEDEIWFEYMAKEKESGAENRIYELAYLFVPTLEETQAMSRFNELKTMLGEKGAEMISEDIPRLIDLAYEMNRTIENKKTWFDTGYFGWIKFDISPEVISSIDEKLMRDETIIRFMIIKTVKESTVVSKKPLGMKKRFDKEDVSSDEVAVVDDAAVKEEETPATTEQIDEQIDALITE